MPLLPRFRNMAGLMVLLAALWLAAFVYHEHMVPAQAARRCLWRADGPPHQTTVLLVADPQLIDSHTYPGRSAPLMALSRHTVDTYLKQNYRALLAHLAPDHVVFLGDYLDNGRLAPDAYFAAECRRFERVFGGPPAYARGAGRRHTNVAGNHDIGFGDGVKLPLRERFAARFGAPNALLDIGGADFVVLDTVSYSASGAASTDARAFVLLLPPKTRPRVLLSHVPLFRDAALTCGPPRESREVWLSAGYQYQLQLSRDVLDELWAAVRPDLVFSGDDHDYCDVQHPGAAREITVKSISMAMGIRRPAVQLLSFSADAGSLDYRTDICYLPTPYVNVAVYVGLAVLSGLLLLFYSVKLRRYVYAVLPSEQVTAVFLERGNAPMAKRISKFYEGENAPATSLAPLSNYTKTSLSSMERWLRRARAWRAEALLTLRRWNLHTFLRLCAVLGLTTLCIYIIVVSLI